MSTGDKRSVATDALATLGTIIGPNEKRDAIHLAVEPVVAGERLRPGEHIRIDGGVAFGTDVGEGLGIVDPFLARQVPKGERFWFVMYPRMVHSLRHVWTHPAFPDSDGVAAPTHTPVPVVSEKASAEAWIRAYADRLDVGYVDLVSSAGEWLDHEGYMVRGGVLEGVSTIDEFWDHYATLTGRDVPNEKRENFFSCSC